MKRLLALCCGALARSLYAVAAESSNTVSIQLIRQGLHDRPANLRSILQSDIDAVDNNDYDAILLTYGICGRATVGLRARQTPLVIPRAHDCITLYLGSMERYNYEFTQHPGTFWYSVDYLERLEEGASDQLGAAGISELTEQHEKYIRKYGKKRADFLIEEFKRWAQHYSRAVFIDTGHGDRAGYEIQARNRAQQEGWLFERVRGDKRLLDMLVNGIWPEDEFLIVPPGHSIQQSYDTGLIRAIPDLTH